MSQTGALPPATISPPSLVQNPANRCTPEPEGTSAFKSTMGPPFSHRNAVVHSLHPPATDSEAPTTCPFELILSAALHGSPSKVPRSVITPFLHRNPWFA